MARQAESSNLMLQPFAFQGMQSDNSTLPLTSKFTPHLCRILAFSVASSSLYLIALMSTASYPERMSALVIVRDKLAERASALLVGDVADAARELRPRASQVGSRGRPRLSIGCRAGGRARGGHRRPSRKFCVAPWSDCCASRRPRRVTADSSTFTDSRGGFADSPEACTDSR